MKEEKFPRTTEVPMVEPIMENVKADVDEQNKKTNDFPTNSNEVIDKTPPDPTLGTLEDKEIDSVSINNDAKQVQAPKEENADFEELNVVNQELDQPVDFIICSIPKEPIKSLKEQAIVSKVDKEDQIVEIPHIDFIFGNQPLISKYCVQLVQINDLQYVIVRSHIRVESKRQKNHHLQSTSKCLKRSNQASKPCQEQEDQEQLTIVRLVFDPGGHLLNSRTSSFPEGGN